MVEPRQSVSWSVNRKSLSPWEGVSTRIAGAKGGAGGGDRTAPSIPHVGHLAALAIRPAGLELGGGLGRQRKLLSVRCAAFGRRTE